MLWNVHISDDNRCLYSGGLVSELLPRNLFNIYIYYRRFIYNLTQRLCLPEPSPKPLTKSNPFFCEYCLNTYYIWPLDIPYTSMCYRGGVLFTYFEWQDQAIQQVLDTPFPIYCLLFITSLPFSLSRTLVSVPISNTSTCLYFE